MKAKLVENGSFIRNVRRRRPSSGESSGEKMAGVWLGHRTPTFGLGNRYGSSREGAEGKRCPTLTEDRAKK